MHSYVKVRNLARAYVQVPFFLITQTSTNLLITSSGVQLHLDLISKHAFSYENNFTP